ncbi:minor capsid protein [Sporofaciens musculi]|uniref:minor capsid protein n=1 Tax=Sporofaciens musculi TaxID=2681861 RepID=UPI00259CE2CC|nr:minor capsid protein [Sporofaciens musculi]
MDSHEYWRNREREQLKHNITDEVEYRKHIGDIYAYMMEQIQKEINGFYAKYAKKESITLSEAKKRVSKLDIEEYGRKAAKYVKDKDFSDEANEEMRLYNATMKINRLEMLKANIGLELVDGFNDLQKYFEKILTKRTLEEFKRQAGILGNTILDNEKAAHAIVNASFHNAKFSDRVWLYQNMLKAELSKLLQTGLIQGRHPRVLARHLVKLFGVRRVDAERLMCTELARVQTEAQKLSFERNGYDEYEFIALDTACKICKAINGKRFKVKDMMPGDNAPPMHPRCRCSTAAYMDRNEFERWLSEKDEMKLSIPDEIYAKSGMSSKTRNKINQAIHKLEQEYNVYLDRLEGGHLGTRDLFISGGFVDNDGVLKHSIVFNYDIDYEEVERRMKLMYNKKQMAGKSFEDYLAHEFAHILPFQNCVTAEEYQDLRNDLKNQFVSGVSGYADRSRDGAESLAEAFVRYRNGEEIPDESRELIQRYITPWRR